MVSSVDNTEAYGIVRWILDNADTGFFIITAPHRQQRQIAEIHTSPRVACYDYSSHGEHYSYYALSEWANAHQDADVLFILNMQVALQEKKNLADFNVSRDMLARKDKIWIFVMTKDAEHRLSTFAHDIYSYVRMKAHFQAEEETSPKELQILHFHDRQSVQKIKVMLEQYKALEEQLMSLSLHDTPDTKLLSAAITLADIANLYYDCAEYGDSFRLLEKGLQIREKVLGSEHPDTAATYNNIAGVYDNQGDYPKALEWYQKALAIRKKVLGSEHPDTAAMYNNIAGVYSSQGDYPKALEWYQKALAISEKVLGREHPDTAATYNNIALVYTSQGDYPKALEWYQKALAIREKLLGREHPDTATTYNNIALVCASQGDYPKALEWYQKALAIMEKVLGNEHPDTAATYNNIAGVYDNQGDYPKALEWYQKALAISEKVLGSEHPSTAATYNNIAGVYSRQGDYPKALEWYIKSYKGLLRLGEAHPSTTTVKANMKSAYQNTSLDEPFEQWLQKSLGA